MQKIALLVCCGSYPGGNSILPARKNGRDLEAALRRHGFDVKVENDLDLRRFSAAIEHFGQRMAQLPNDGHSIGLIYFCGHGMQIDGRNYLLPAGIATTDPKAKDLSINLQEKLLAAFPQRYPGLGMAVIDACRTSTNDKVGAFNYSTAPEGCIMAFSASAGQVSLSPADPDKNSFYTQELVGALNDVDEETPITDIFEFTRRRVEKTMTNHPEAAVRQLAQRPHMTSGRTGMFVLAEHAPSPWRPMPKTTPTPSRPPPSFLATSRKVLKTSSKITRTAATTPRSRWRYRGPKTRFERCRAPLSGYPLALFRPPKVMNSL